MANQGSDGSVGFQSESGNVDFQPETGGQQQQQQQFQQQPTAEGHAGVTDRIGEAAQAVNWGKVGVGVGAAAAVAGAAYAASRFVGRGSEDSTSERRSGDTASGGGSGRS
jgi:hypothetical protein